MILTSLIREWKDLSRFKALEPRLRNIVFYAEDHSSWADFEPIVKRLNSEAYTSAAEELDQLDSEPFVSFRDARHAVAPAQDLEKLGYGSTTDCWSRDLIT